MDRNKKKRVAEELWKLAALPTVFWFGLFCSRALQCMHSGVYSNFTENREVSHVPVLLQLLTKCLRLPVFQDGKVQK